MPMRLVGLVGDFSKVNAFVSAAPMPVSTFVHTQGNEVFVGQQDVLIANEENILFDWGDFDEAIVP